MQKMAFVLVVVGLSMMRTPLWGGDGVTGVSLALDNTVSNEFWCTWNYSNAVSSNAVCVVAGGVDSVRVAASASVADVRHPFSSWPSGGVIIVR